MTNGFATQLIASQLKGRVFMSGFGKTFAVLAMVGTGAGVFISAPDKAQAIGFEMLAPHMAVYDVVLEDATDRSGIDGLSGRMVYEVKGNECDGISIRYRFVTNVQAGQKNMITDQQMESYESADGKEFSFSNKSLVNDQLDQNVVGVAEREDDGISVKFTKPDAKEVVLSDAAFMSSHLVEVITNAKAGEHFIKRDIYDGSGTADEVIASSSVISDEKIIDKAFKDENVDAVKPLKNGKAWQVSTSYFKKGVGNTAESLPIYEASFLLYSDGVSRNVKMRYPDYTLRAQLQKLDYLERTKCE